MSGPTLDEENDVQGIGEEGSVGIVEDVRSRLQEDDEINDDLHVPEHGPIISISKSNRSTGEPDAAPRSARSTTSTTSDVTNSDNDEYTAELQTERPSSRNSNSNSNSNSFQRRPPRHAHSASSGSSSRLTKVQGVGSKVQGVGSKVQGVGSVHRRRTTRRVAAAEKQWGNSSMPAITVRDLLGSEKKATAVGMTGSDHSKGDKPPISNRDSKSGAENKRTLIRSRKTEKRRRKVDVKNSLAQFLNSTGGGGEEEVEDDDLISDEGDGHKKSSGRSVGPGIGTRRQDDNDSDDGKSVKSTKSQSRGSRRRQSTVLNRPTDGNNTDGDVPGSSDSKPRNARRRLKSSTGGDDDQSVGGSTRSSRRSSRRTSRQTPDGESTRRRRSIDGERMQREGSVDAERRRRSGSVDAERMRGRRNEYADAGATKGQRSGSVDAERMRGRRDGSVDAERKRRDGSVDAERMQRRKESEEGEKKPMRSRRRQSTGHGSDPSKSSRRKEAVDDDDRSVGSRKSVGGRRRRQHQQKVLKKTKPEGTPPLPSSSKPQRVIAIAAPVSPLSSAPTSQASLLDSPSKAEKKDKLTSLSKHIESTPLTKIAQDLEEKSEESSRFSASYERPTSLLQFDPTNANNFTMVSQEKAKITSEKIRHADGTESELQISELAGLPTFETEQPDVNDSQNSFGSEMLHQSQRSLGSIDYTADHEGQKSHRSLSNIGFKMTGGSAQKSGQRSEEGETTTNQSGGGGRGVSNSASGGRLRGAIATRSFLARVRNPDIGGQQKPPRRPAGDNGLNDSKKGFFGGWNKKGECESDDDEDGQPKNNRFFRRRDEVEHQVLDDDGSDEN